MTASAELCAWPQLPKDEAIGSTTTLITDSNARTAAPDFHLVEGTQQHPWEPSKQYRHDTWSLKLATTYIQLVCRSLYTFSSSLAQHSS